MALPNSCTGARKDTSPQNGTLVPFTPSSPDYYNPLAPETCLGHSRSHGQGMCLFFSDFSATDLLNRRLGLFVQIGSRGFEVRFGLRISDVLPSQGHEQRLDKSYGQFGDFEWQRE